MHKIICRFLLAVFILLQQLFSYAQNIASDSKRILFLGNSITWAGMYVNDVEVYLTVQYPGRRFEFINVGLSSETVSGLSEQGHAGGSFPRPDLHERLGRVLEQTKPDIVFACYGMNDGIYMPFDTGRFQKFKDGINWLHDEVMKTGARLIHLTPPDYDEVKGKNKGYAAVLELAADGVHPGETRHWIIARQILLYLGFKDVNKSPGIVESIKQIQNAAEFVKLVAKRQNMMRDAWLTATKHLRPGLPVGLPLSEAQTKADEMMREIESFLKEEQ